MSGRLNLEQACSVLAADGIIVYPTETVWGIGGNARSSAASGRVLTAKGIDSPRPFPVLADSVERALVVAKPVDGLKELAAGFWPGSVTAVVPVRDSVLAKVAGHDGKVGLRVCSIPEVGRLAASCGGFLLSTSANSTGEPPPQSPGEVSPELVARTDGLLVWSGDCAGLPSTVIAWEPSGWAVVREGAVPMEEIARVIPLRREP